MVNFFLVLHTQTVHSQLPYLLDFPTLNLAARLPLSKGRAGTAGNKKSCNFYVSIPVSHNTYFFLSLSGL
jgi:hypothetical protein